MISIPLFESDHLRLAAPDQATDAAVEAQWTVNLDYAQWLREEAVRPLMASEIKIRYQEDLKKQLDHTELFSFAIRLKDPDRLLGFIRIPWISWNNSAGFFRLDFGSPADTASYGQEALALALQYLFDELNLYRVGTQCSESQANLVTLLVQAGFKIEVRRRQAIFRAGRYQAALHLGLLRSEYARDPVGPDQGNPEAQTATPDSLAGEPVSPLLDQSPTRPLPPCDDDIFCGQIIRLAIPDLEKDGATITSWNESEFLRLANSEPARLFTTPILSEFLEGIFKKCFGFTIRTRMDDRLVGDIDLSGINWTSGDSWVGIGIGQREDWGKGYGTEAMQLILRYAFQELNLRRVSLTVFEYNPRGIRSYLKAGFREEGRQRHFLHRAGRRWDMVFMGILRSEWEALQTT
jgi:RimJ/RimL family protein N-acetyltransferase